MQKLRVYLNGLSPEAQAAFAKRCNTSVGYLRKAISVGSRLSEGLCLRIAAESAGIVRPSDLRPELDWQRLLSCQHREATPPTTEPATAGD